jgi:DNA helicase MCM8
MSEEDGWNKSLDKITPQNTHKIAIGGNKRQTKRKIVEDDAETAEDDATYQRRPQQNSPKYEDEDDANVNAPPYWNMYFPGENYNDAYYFNDEAKRTIDAFVSYLTMNKETTISSTPDDNGNKKLGIQPEMGDSGEWIINLDFKSASNALPFLSSMLSDTPLQTIARFEFAAHLVFATRDDDNIRYTVRIYNLDPDKQLALRNLKASQIGKFVQVKGTVVRVSNIKQVATQITFDCQKCGSKMIRYFVENTFIPPNHCKNRSCKSKKFEPDRYNAITVDWQRIRIQENVEKDEEHEAGRIPRTVECEITKDLVESCVPGDQVTVCGVVKVISTDQHAEGGIIRGGSSRGKAKCMYFLYLEGNSLLNTKNKKEKGSKSDYGVSIKSFVFTIDSYQIQLNSRLQIYS